MTLFVNTWPQGAEMNDAIPEVLWLVVSLTKSPALLTNAVPVLGTCPACLKACATRLIQHSYCRLKLSW